MATTTWNGGSTNYETGANWTGTGAKPANTNDVIIPQTTQIFTSGHTDENTVTANSITILPTCLHNVGATGSQWYIGATDLFHYGSGKLWFKDGDGTTSRVIIDGPINADLADIDGTVAALLSVIRGTCTVAGAAGAIPRVEVGFRGARDTDANLIVVAGAGTFTDFNQRGGTCTASNTITLAEIHGGRLIKPAGATTTCNVYPGGYLDYQNSTTITTLRLYEGAVADFTKCTAAVTVTNLYRYPGSVLLQNKILGAPTVTNTFDFRGNV